MGAKVCSQGDRKAAVTNVNRSVCSSRHGVTLNTVP
jgi:hypothetical protein